MPSEIGTVRVSWKLRWMVCEICMFFRYTDCIDDCSKAVLLDPKLVKGFYRRMQANEVLSNFDLALKDCKEVLKLDPKNTDAIQANQRLSKRIAGKGTCKASL